MLPFAWRRYLPSSHAGPEERAGQHEEKDEHGERTVKPVPRIRQASPVTKTTTTAVTSGGTPRTPLRTTSQELLSAALAASHGTTTTNGSANGISSKNNSPRFGIRGDATHPSMRRWLHCGQRSNRAATVFFAPSGSLLSQASTKSTRKVRCGITKSGSRPLVTA